MTVPDPLAADGAVVNDAAERTLIVKPAEAGYAAVLWRSGLRDLLKAEESGRYYTAPTVWAHGAGRREISRGEPAEDGSLRFKFRRGDPAYKDLVSTPGLSAIVVVDRATSQIMGVRFHNRRRP